MPVNVHMQLFLYDELPTFGAMQRAIGDWRSRPWPELPSFVDDAVRVWRTAVHLLGFTITRRDGYPFHYDGHQLPVVYVQLAPSTKISFTRKTPYTAAHASKLLVKAANQERRLIPSVWIRRCEHEAWTILLERLPPDPSERLTLGYIRNASHQYATAVESALRGLRSKSQFDTQTVPHMYDERGNFICTLNDLPPPPSRAFPDISLTRIVKIQEPPQ